MITVTDSARKRILANLAQRGRGRGITIGIRTTGCSGLAYTLEYLDATDTELAITDYLYEGFVIRVRNEHVPIVEGMTVNYVRQGLNEGFEFTNSREQDRCGCGESFRLS